MAVKIRLKRVGTKKRPFYRVIAIDGREKRDGRELEVLGQYQPVVEGTQFSIDEEKVLSWLKKGAQPTDTVRQLLKKDGFWSKYKASK